VPKIFTHIESGVCLLGELEDPKYVPSVSLARRQSDRKFFETGLAPAQEAQLLQRLLTPIKDLTEYGYVPTVPPEEAIKKVQEGREAGKGWD
jgi:hypothetical protein